MYNNIYFIGIGGIGMSAIARYYKFKGLNVSGYDRTESELTRQLVAEGIGVHYTDSPELIPEDTEKTLVVYTPAIPHDLNELVTVRQKGYKVVKRSQMLGEITRGHHQHPGGPYPHAERRGLLGLPWRNFQELRHQPSDERQ